MALKIGAADSDKKESTSKADTPFLEYLSACSTGTSKFSKLADEGIHLMSAFQLVGFKHVVGSLRELADEPCAGIAADVYNELLQREGPEAEAVVAEGDDEAVCRALHKAVLRMRAGSFVGGGERSRAASPEKMRREPRRMAI